MNRVNSSWLVPTSTGTCAARPAANAASGSDGNIDVPVTGPVNPSVPMRKK